MVNRVELAILLLAMAAAWVLRGTGFFRKTKRMFARLANRKSAAIVFVGVLATGLSAALAVGFHWPEPRIHDEFSYLLAADTFASGRVTSPTHPLWVFFETFHVNQLPTYCSIYPPGQGLFLALGQFVTGEPIAGVWLSFGLACAAVCWMLQAHVPPRWALFGALLCMIRIGFLGSWAGQQGYWSQSYWGGTLAMLGGALAFGAVPRLCREPRLRHAVVLGIGLAILALSRPYEGMAATLPIVVVIEAWLFRDHTYALAERFVRIILPLVLLLGLTLGGWAYYNFRLTENPFELAYQRSEATYSVVPTYIWQSLQPEPTYHHDVIRDYQVRWAGERYAAKRTVEGFAADLTTRCHEFVSFFLGVTLLIPLIALPWIIRHSSLRFAAAGCVTVLLALGVTTWFQPHYAAPLTAPLFALVIYGIRYVRAWRWDGRPFGRLYVRAVPFAYVGLFIVAVGVISEAPADSWHISRARLLRQLESDGDMHLVIIRYGPGHDCTEEWVYNRADIDAAPVVWARDMGPEANQRLIDYFPQRRVLNLEVKHSRVGAMP